MADKTIHDFQLESWGERASYYDDYFADVTTQAIEDILGGLGILKERHHLDIACGTGHLVAEASKRGAMSEGTDFAQAMIDVARSNYPTDTFNLADATDLPYDSATFDCVTCSFGLAHMENPQAVVREVYRVLKAQGRFAFTLWYGRNDGNEIRSIIQNAFKVYGNPSLSLPEAWEQLKNPSFEECGNLVSQSGFINPVFKRLPIVIQATSTDHIIDVISNLSLSTKLLIERHSETEQQNILDYIASEVEAHRTQEGVISLNFPALLTIAQKRE